MHSGKLVFAQIMSHLPLSTFSRCIENHRGDFKVKDFSCLDQFYAMAFAQLAGRESLRDTVANLRVQSRRLYHLGFRCATVSLNTLAHANATRPWQIYRDLAQHLIAIARPMYADAPLGSLDQSQTEAIAKILGDVSIYAFDATTIDLCLCVFPWAPFRRAKAGIKLHTLLDVRGSIPSFIHITDAKTHEVNAFDELHFEVGAFYLVDRGYLDFARLYALHQAQAFFVIRAKANTKTKRRYSHPVDREQSNVLCDQTVTFSLPTSRGDYPGTLRRIVVFDENRQRVTFLTNNFALAAPLIAALYRQRWQVELFFKWIKQHLRITSFFGHSENAVKAQIWIATCTYLLVAIAKKRLQLAHMSLYEFLQILGLNLFETVPLIQLLTPTSQQNASEFHSIQGSLL